MARKPLSTDWLDERFEEADSSPDVLAARTSSSPESNSRSSRSSRSMSQPRSSRSRRSKRSAATSRVIIETGRSTTEPSTMGSVDSSRDSSTQSRSKRSVRKSSEERGETLGVETQPSMLPATRDPRITLANPAGSIALRDEILALAGADKNALAGLTKKALRVADEAMDATKVWRSTHEGVVIEEREDIDHRTRIEGADRAFDLIGARVSKSSSSQQSSGPQTVVVVIERATGPQRVEAHEIIEVAATPQEH